MGGLLEVAMNVEEHLEGSGGLGRVGVVLQLVGVVVVEMQLLLERVEVGGGEEVSGKQELLHVPEAEHQGGLAGVETLQLLLLATHLVQQEDLHLLLLLDVVLLILHPPLLLPLGSSRSQVAGPQSLHSPLLLLQHLPHLPTITHLVATWYLLFRFTLLLYIYHLLLLYLLFNRLLFILRLFICITPSQ